MSEKMFKAVQNIFDKQIEELENLMTGEAMFFIQNQELEHKTQYLKFMYASQKLQETLEEIKSL